MTPYVFCSINCSISTVEDPITGELGVPLLRLGFNGVIVFWCMTFGFTAIVAYVMYKKKFFDNQMK